jgi:hypothetical protein
VTSRKEELLNAKFVGALDHFVKVSLMALLAVVFADVALI